MKVYEFENGKKPQTHFKCQLLPKSIYQTLYIENIKIRIVEAGIRIEAT